MTIRYIIPKDIPQKPADPPHKPQQMGHNEICDNPRVPSTFDFPEQEPPDFDD